MFSVGARVQEKIRPLLDAVMGQGAAPEPEAKQIIYGGYLPFPSSTAFFILAMISFRSGSESEAGGGAELP